jgi:hypothetical protein
MPADLLDLAPLADLIALSPSSYAFRVLIGVSGFIASLNVDNTISRVIGLVVVLLLGAGLLFMGITHGTIVDIVLGFVGLAAAGYSWWHTRH